MMSSMALRMESAVVVSGLLLTVLVAMFSGSLLLSCMCELGCVDAVLLLSVCIRR